MPQDLTVAEIRKILMESTHLSHDLKTKLNVALRKLEIEEKTLEDIKFEIDRVRSSLHPCGVLGDIEGLNREERLVTEMEVGRALDTNSVMCEIGRCSFCGKTDREGAKIIQGPLVAICSDCVHICNVQLEKWENASST
jgi:hypothetical protein